ncbi:prepilin-type N-terminal cleavage/methylation domain-containing protein [Companilactobacillus sp. HBUAS59699]|uniref:prepilin-type N-terminal cleavage/methylation domain-containing protein n=1 Tax=Companilactobacillus sp. HBUAS59699 TaxID=3109358 RepID=UPI002FF3D99A
MKLEKKLLLHKNKAFTLIETVISLTIFCTLASVSIYGIHDYQQKIEEKQIISQYKVNWHNMLNYSYLNKRRTRFFYNYDDNTMLFSDFSKRDKFDYKIKLPSTLKSTQKHDIEIYVGDEGMTGPKTIELKSSVTHRVYDYTVQMMWGELVEK